MFPAALFIIAKLWKQPKHPSVYVQHVLYNCNPTFALPCIRKGNFLMKNRKFFL